jgi:Family of unknown function (DUF5694)
VNALLSLLMLCVAQPSADATKKKDGTQVLVLGVFHMASPGRNLINPGVKDVLGPRRSKEILDVATRLQNFRPTKIALEAPVGARAMQDRLDKLAAGTYVLSADERDQIGLRLARMLGHDKVYGVDFQEELDFDDVFRSANESGQQALLQRAFAEFNSIIKPKLESDYMEKHTVRELLLEANAQETLTMSHRIYVGLLPIGKGERYPGANLVSRWYDRNLRIAANIARLAEEKPQRILVIIGAGHAKLLRQFLSEMPGFQVVDCETFL